MKKTLLSIVGIIFSCNVYAGDIPINSGEATYKGNIEGVAVGFYGHVGVGLPTGETCNGQRSLVY